MSVRLKDIHIGKADGLKESEDANFESLFYKENQKYSLLCENKSKFIISGKKGTGKTILAKYFEKEQVKLGIPTKTLTKREFVLRSLIEKGSLDLQSYEYDLFIEYVILVEIAKIILDNKKYLCTLRNIFKCRLIGEKIKYLNEIVNERVSIENFETKEFGLKESGNRSATLGGKYKNESSELNANSTVQINSELAIQYQKTPYYNFIDKLKKDIFYLMGFLSVNVIFDDLDEVDEQVDGNVLVMRCLISFIEAASRLNAEIRKKGIENSRVIILIRTDIIKELNNYSSNLNKIVSDSEIKLNWIKKISDTEIHPLFDLIITKIQNSNELLKNKSKQEILQQFFPVKVNGVPVIDHMLNMSFGRPRDIINMLNIIKEEYPDNTSFESECYKATLQEYSAKFLDELRNELSTHYNAECIKECFWLIHNINKKIFWFKDVQNIFSNYKEDIKFFETEEHFLDFSYQFGIIGNTWENERDTDGRKYNFSWKYREDGYEKPDYHKAFYLHLALRKSLLN